MYFRANVLFRNFEVKGGADKTLIYLTLHAVQCLVKCEKIEDKNSGMNDDIICTCLNLNWTSIIVITAALKELRALSTKQFAILASLDSH